MVLKNYEQIITSIKEKKSPKRVAVVAAEDKHTLEALVMAYKDSVIAPVLIGSTAVITSYLEELGVSAQEICIVEATDSEAAARIAVEMINTGKADFIMKGLVETSVLMKVLVSKESNLRTERIMSHISFLEVPTYHKLLVVSDAALVPTPDLDQKKQILQNAVETMKRMGVEQPKVGVMAAVEEINPKMIETVEANELKKMWQSGEIEGCIVEGPISYDLAMDKESSAIKGYNSPVAGDVDLMIVPNLTAGNLMVKGLLFSGNSKVAGFIVGAKVPIVLTSRASTTEDKYYSLVVAASAC